MKQSTVLKSLVCSGALLLAFALCAQAALDTNQIERITGLKGKWNPEESVFKVSQPRTDVKVSVDNWQMPPFMGLTSWAAFKPGIKENAMVMGDLVLFQDEVNPVMSVLFENGVEVTALHNHFFYDNPKVYFHAHRRRGQRGETRSGCESRAREDERDSQPEATASREFWPCDSHHRFHFS
jgi:hypothetical protein